MPKISSDASGGLQIRRAEHQVGPGSFLELADADLEASGALSVRTGYREVQEPDGGSEKGEALFYRGEELALLRDAKLWSYSDSLETWADRGPCWLGRLRESGLARDQTNQRFASMDESGPYLTMLWTEGLTTDEPIYWQVYDRASLAAITSRVSVDDGAQPVVEAATTWVALAWYVFDPAGSPTLDDRIELAYWDPGNAAPTPTGAWPVGAGTQNDLAKAFALRASGNDTVAIAVIPNGAAPIEVQEFQRSTSIQQVSQTGGTSTNGADYVELVKLQINSNAAWALVWLANGSPDTIYVRWLDSSMALLAESSITTTWNTTTITPVAVENIAGDVAVTYSNRSAPSANYGGGVEYYLATYDGTTPGMTSQGTQLGVVASSRPVVVRNRVVQPLVMEDDTQIIVGTTTPRSSFSSAFVVHDVDQQSVIARSSATGYALDLQMIGSPVETVLRGDIVRWLGIYVVPPELPTYTGDQGYPVLHDLDMSRRSVASANIQQIAHLPGGGFAWAYDGRGPFELDFHTRPTVQSENLAPAGSVDVGTHSWSFQFQWEDARGNLYRSAPKIYEFTLAGNANPVFTVRSYHQTQRDNVKLVVGRTQVTTTNDPTFYRVDDNTVLAPTTSQTISFTDTTSDALAIDNEIVLPSSILQQGAGGGELFHFPTPCTDFMVAAGQRLWFGDPRLANAVRFSLPQVSGYGMAASPLQAVRLPTDARATALAQQDRTYFGFTAGQVFYWQGVGPNADGTGQAFSEASQTPAEYGATGQTCVVLTPAGICYVGFNGPVLLARDRASANAIEAVGEAYLYLGQDCTSAVYEPLSGSVRFYDSGPGVKMEGPQWKRMTLRWHVSSGRWCHDTRHQALDGAISAEGKSAFLRTDGTVCLHASRYTDGSAPVELYGVTAWLRLGGIAPEQQVDWVDVVGQWLSAHTLELDLRKDYNWEPGAGDTTFEPTLLIDPSRDNLRAMPSSWSDGSGTAYHFRWQTCGVRTPALSVAFRIVHDGTANPGAIVALELDVQGLSDNPAPIDQRRVY